MQYTIFITAPRGVEPLLVAELQQLGITTVKEARAGARATVTLAEMYRICLWSRLASRVLLQIASFPCATEDELYTGVHALDWNQQMSLDTRFAVTYTATQAAAINHTQYGAQRVKDAVVDWYREQTGERPTVDRDNPQIRINVHAEKTRATVSIDMSGESLHRRGYRAHTVAAPLKENLAAAVLAVLKWPFDDKTTPVVDPMCGSATLLIEAFQKAADIAPGLLRLQWGFQKWPQHQPELWKQEVSAAKERQSAGLNELAGVEYAGFDQDRHALKAAQASVEAAGLQDHIVIKHKPLRHHLTDEHEWPERGFLVTNPPYGERLGEEEALKGLYETLGDLLKSRMQGWHAGLITGNPKLAHMLGLRSAKPRQLFNGAIPCKVLGFHVTEENTARAHIPDDKPKVDISNDGAQSYGNRLKKNLRHRNKWARREGLRAYRVYDKDLPEYAVAVDVYHCENGETHVLVQESKAPATIAASKAATRLAEAIAMTQQVFEVPAQHVHVKTRQRQLGNEQYQKSSDTAESYLVDEHGCLLEVNFDQYLDTGVFLDHRPIRRMFQQQARGAKMLNLFGYTGAASVQAALGGAAQVTTVDMSATYLEWAKRNFVHNGLAPQEHKFIQVDCTEWLSIMQASPVRPRYDLIFLDPPTFSNSKRMEGTFDVQNDHRWMIEAVMDILADDGLLVFSTNYRRFKLDDELCERFAVQDITAISIPEDFARNQKIHYCYEITHTAIP